MTLENAQPGLLVFGYSKPGAMVHCSCLYQRFLVLSAGEAMIYDSDTAQHSTAQGSAA